MDVVPQMLYWPGSCGSFPSCCCTGMARPSKPFRMSVTPAASQIRTPGGSAIIAQRRQHAPQGRQSNTFIDPDPAAVGEIDLDPT